jgi:hypothetical protein
MNFQRLRHFVQPMQAILQRQLIVFLAVYVVLFGPLLTGWQFGGGHTARTLPASWAQLVAAPSDRATCGAQSSTPANLWQCSTIPLRGLPRMFVVPGTFILALLLIALLIIAHQIQLLAFVRVALPPPLDDPPPRYPPRSL